MNETQWQKAVTAAAIQNGWQWLHIGRVGKHRANGAKGTLGTGWPDLVLSSNRGILFVELKVDGERLTEAQQLVRQHLIAAGAEYRIWRPSDFAAVMHELVGGV